VQYITRHKIHLQHPRQRRLVRCDICIRRCDIAPGRSGYCQTIVNVEGSLYSTNFDRVSSESPDPIEKKPVYHFWPGSRVYTLGGWGCNLFCQYCRNYEVACLPNAMEAQGYPLTPQEVVQRALAAGCQGIGWSYSEPTVWFDFTYACAREAKRHGLFTVYVTNGTLSPEALDLIGPYLDCWRVDLKGFSDRSYTFLGNLRNWREILERTEAAQKQWGMHVEVVTCLTPTINDSDAELRALAGWMAQTLGERVPWHVQRFYPLYKMGEYPMTLLDDLYRVRQIGVSEGLKFVYLGNCLAEGGADTVCPACRALLVKRRGRLTPEVHLANDGSCPACGYKTGIQWAPHAIRLAASGGR
jgi:pyruvate formate lyase activating enzyme